MGPFTVEGSGRCFVVTVDGVDVAGPFDGRDNAWAAKDCLEREARMKERTA